MPNCQEGFDEYVSLGTRRRPIRWDRTFSVARVDGDVAGYAEWRDLNDTWFLNHLCTRPSKQGLGIARSLVGCPPDSGQNPFRIELDVFNEEPAFTFYQHLGLQATSSSDWHFRSAAGIPAPGEDDNELISSSIPFFEKNMSTFGFSQIEVSWLGRPTTISLPSIKVARLADVRHFEDENFLAAIKAAIPTIERFAVICYPDAPANSADATLRSSRLSGLVPAQLPRAHNLTITRHRPGWNQ
jgi:hypothetical protein